MTTGITQAYTAVLDLIVDGPENRRSRGRVPCDKM